MPPRSIAALAFLLAFTARGAEPALTMPLPPPAEWTLVAQDLPPDISVEQVAALPDNRFQAYDPKLTFLPGDGHPPVWLRLRLPALGPTAQPAILVPGKGYDDYVDLFLPDARGGWQRRRNGEAVAPAQRDWFGLQTAFLVQLPPAGRETIAHLRIEQPLFPQWSVRLEPDVPAYVAAEERQLALVFAYFGALGAIFAYNFFLYLRLRYRDLLYYLCYMAAFGVMMALDTSALWLVLPLGDPLRVSGLLALFNLALAALLAFVREYHELPRLMPRTARAVRWAALVFAAASGVYWLNLHTGRGPIIYNTNVLLMLATLGAVPVISVLAWRRGARQARFFLAAFGCYLLSMLTVIISGEFLHFLTTPQESMIALAGSAAEFLLLSFAIGDRFRRIREEKETLQANYTAQLERDVATRTAELARLNAEKDELMGVVAHDLRAPLGALRGTARLVRASPTLTAPDDREALDDITVAADRMLHLASTLLDRHVVERGQVPVNLVTADVRPALAEAAKRFRGAAGAKQQTLPLEVHDSPLVVRHDPALLAQVLDNFVSNALKFSPPGAAIHLIASRRPDGAARLTVHDAGPGLSETDLAKVFQPFARLDARPTAGETSIGLGLAAARKLTLAMGGQVGAENAKEGGATFWVELPAG